MSDCEGSSTQKCDMILMDPISHRRGGRGDLYGHSLTILLDKTNNWETFWAHTHWLLVFGPWEAVCKVSGHLDQYDKFYGHFVTKNSFFYYYETADLSNTGFECPFSNGHKSNSFQYFWMNLFQSCQKLPIF